MLYFWYPKKQRDWGTIHEENDVIMPEDLASVKKQLRQGKHTCLVMRTEHPGAYETPYKTPAPIALLSRD